VLRARARPWGGCNWVNGLVGGLLAHAGAEVAFVARARQLDAMRSTGLRVESPRAADARVFRPSRAESRAILSA
jgi:2-dehydropantoate 2-reductase